MKQIKDIDDIIEGKAGMILGIIYWAIVISIPVFTACSNPPSGREFKIERDKCILRCDPYLMHKYNHNRRECVCDLTKVRQ